MIRITITQEKFPGQPSWEQRKYHRYYNNTKDAKKVFDWLNAQQFGELIDEVYCWNVPCAYTRRGGDNGVTTIELYKMTSTKECTPFCFEFDNELINKYV